MEALSIGMTKAAFVLWRDNLDIPLEEFVDFGMGTNEFSADRELYKLLHKKLTVKLEAAPVLTCQAGMGFELYRIINKNSSQIMPRVSTPYWPTSVDCHV